MATGAQAAQLATSKLGEATSLDMCVHGIVYEVYNVLGIPCPQTSLISTFLDGKLMTQIGGPVVGGVARWPRSKGYEHVSIITAVNGSQIVEQSWGTSNGVVRAFTYDASFFESFWTPQFDGSNSTVNVENAGALSTVTGTVTAAEKIGTVVSGKGFWVRVGVGALGAVLVLFALLRILKDSGAVDAVKSGVSKAAETAALVAPK